MADPLVAEVDAQGAYLVDPIFRAEVDRLVLARPVFLQLANTIPVYRRTVNLQNVLTRPRAGLGERERPEADLDDDLRSGRRGGEGTRGSRPVERPA